VCSSTGFLFNEATLATQCDIPGGFPDPRIPLSIVFDIIQRTGKAVAHTKRITAAMVALIHRVPLGLEAERSEGAGGHAHPAADAAVVVDQDPVQPAVSVNRLPRTYRHTGSILAMLADNGQKKTLSIMPYDTDAGLSRVPHTGFDHGTNGPAERTAVAFFRIGYKRAIRIHL
jgi:hypothetical protein